MPDTQLCSSGLKKSRQMVPSIERNAPPRYVQNKLPAVVHLIRTHHSHDDRDMRFTIPEAFPLRYLDVLDCKMEPAFSTRRSISNGQVTGYNRPLKQTINFVT
ncbi:MAG: hypothetical protein KBS74_04595 [Clostridiales bacterium]|nr:hypothetical protein [Candidatus Cacconaster stercorequi]